MITSGRMSMSRHSSRRKQHDQQQEQDKGSVIHEATNAVPDEQRGEVSTNGREPNPEESYRKLELDY